MLGLYVSDHPLLGLEHVLRRRRRLLDRPADRRRRDGRTVSRHRRRPDHRRQRKVTKQGNPWAVATLEDLEGAIEVMFFPQTYQLGVAPARRGRRRRWSAAGSSATTTSPSWSRWRSRCPTCRDGHAAGGHHAAGRPVHAAGGRAAQGGARDPPRHDRGAPAAAGRGKHDGAAARRPAAGQPVPP